MDKILWEKIAALDLDDPISEYGFSTRLAAENFWTQDFTRKAILEYKKFMYLAGTSSFMVSPSEIVDTVWHQHLIFTKSYADFCQVIPKFYKNDILPKQQNREAWAWRFFLLGPPLLSASIAPLVESYDSSLYRDSSSGWGSSDSSCGSSCGSSCSSCGGCGGD